MRYPRNVPATVLTGGGGGRQATFSRHSVPRAPRLTHLHRIGQGEKKEQHREQRELKLKLKDRSKVLQPQYPSEH